MNKNEAYRLILSCVDLYHFPLRYASDHDSIPIIRLLGLSMYIPFPYENRIQGIQVHPPTRSHLAVFHPSLHRAAQAGTPRLAVLYL